MAFGTAAVVVVAILVFGELMIWIASPTEYLYPRYQFSAQYGMIPFANVVMVHGVPRKYQFRYTVNAQQCRGETPEPGEDARPTVVTLGDSYTFGMGVSDGDEYPAVLQRRLANRVSVVNLGEPGWGLTQEIRRYYDFGERYDPRVVVLQFCANDPDDNLTNRVARVTNGEFVFMESANSLNLIKKVLSRSFVQRTQFYNFFRTRASRVVLARLASREASKLDAARPATDPTGGVPGIEAVHIELLETFARRLHDQGRTLLVISADRQLDQFPHIAAAVHDLDSRGLLRYLEVMDWLRDMHDYASPEGHVWGAPAHRIIGERLADMVAAGLAVADSSATSSP